MSKLEEARIIAIGSSFYKNVFLLTQMLPPSSEFRQHFKKSMFSKPNTAGFIHVSHYLSMIYDTELFKQMVIWPILRKRDEITYRVEMKNFLSVLSQNNPDVKFPPILISNLVQAGGSKFLIIMWKLSQLALRAYIKRESKGELLSIPRASLADDLTITYFNNIIAEKSSVVTEIHNKAKKILDNAKNFLNSEIETLNVYKSEIFNRKENIERLVLNVSTHPLIQQQLMNVEDSNVIDLWKKDILEKVQSVRTKNEELNELKESCKHLCKFISRIKSNSEIFDANKLPKINCDDSLIRTRSELQHLFHDSYADDSIVFSTLLLLLYWMFTQMLHCIDTVSFPDLSSSLPFVQNASRNMKSLQALFIALNTRINSLCRDMQRASRENENVRINIDANSISVANYMLLQSPKIIFNFNQNMDNSLFHEKLCLPLTEGKHRHLFKRYKRKYPSYEMSTTSSDFSSSWSGLRGWLSPRTRSTKCKQVLFNGKPISPSYSRLLRHSKLSLKRFKGNALCSPNYEGLNITPRKHRSISEHLTTNNCDGRARNFFNSAVTSPLNTEN